MSPQTPPSSRLIACAPACRPERQHRELRIRTAMYLLCISAMHSVVKESSWTLPGVRCGGILMYNACIIGRYACRKGRYASVTLAVPSYEWLRHVWGETLPEEVTGAGRPHERRVFLLPILGGPLLSRKRGWTSPTAAGDACLFFACSAPFFCRGGHVGAEDHLLPCPDAPTP